MSDNFYETNKAVSEYLLFHYGDSTAFLEQGLGPSEALDFAKRCASLHTHSPQNTAKVRALDLGCAVGGSSFELSKAFSEVLAIDFSNALIDSAKNLAKLGKVKIPVVVEGDVTRDLEISVPPESNPERIVFQQGDAMALPESIGTFDFVLMANLIDRLPAPARMLKEIHTYINDGGILAITSPYTWLEEYTPKSEWLGGYYDNGEAILSFDTLKNVLSPNFELLETQNMPFLIREHSRKNQFSVAHATLWQRKADF